MVNLGDHNNPFYSCMLSVQAPAIQKAENFIQRIKCIGWSTFYPLNRVIRSLNNRGLMTINTEKENRH